MGYKVVTVVEYSVARLPRGEQILLGHFDRRLHELTKKISFEHGDKNDMTFTIGVRSDRCATCDTLHDEGETIITLCCELRPKALSEPNPNADEAIGASPS